MAANYFQRLQDESRKLFGSLSLTQKLLLGGLGTITIAAIVFISVWSQQPQWATLYGDLNQKDAGAIIDRLKDSKIKYELQTDKEGVSIRVPSGDVHEMRLKMATEGLPKEGGVIGYEIFDKETMGVTNNQFDLNHQRALSGELARTIMQIESVERATVNLAIPKKQLFTELSDDATASVLLKLKPNHEISSPQIRGVSKLVAGSVPGLQQRNVTIADTQGNVLFDKDMLDEENGKGTAKLNAEQLEYQRTVEKQIRQDVEKMVATVVGRGNVNVQLKVEPDFDKEEITSKTFTPNGNPDDLRVLRSEKETKEGGRGKSTATGGVPGVSTNIPSYQENGSEGNSAFSKEDRIRNYEVPETQTKKIKSTGNIKRITLSVVVNSLAPALGAGPEGLELDDPKMVRLRELAIAAAGIDLTRGDTVAVHTMQFDDSTTKAEIASMEREANREFWRSIVALVLLAVGVLALAFTLYMAFGRRRVPPEDELLSDEDRLLEGPSEEGEGEEVILALHDPPEMLELTEAAAKRAAAVKSLTQMAKEDPANMARLLRAWMTEG